MIRPVTARPKRFLAGLLLLAAVFALVRGPLHAVTFSLPVSNDDAILLLMARHILRGELATILWNQPYNGALDAYLLAPGLALGPHHLVFRFYELLCAALLVLLAGLLARRVAGVAAGWAAALLAAWGTPYMGLMTATGPPPNFLMPLVTGFPLLIALRGLERDAPSASARLMFAAGFLYGLGVWNSSLAIPAFAGMAAGLLAAGLRPGGSTFIVLAGLLLGASPLAAARVIGASGSTVVTAASAVTAIRPRWLWMSGLWDLCHAAVGLFGLQVPLVVDGPERAVLPAPTVLALVVGLAVALALGAWSRRALPLLGWAAALAGAFALSRRTGPDDLRYLYGLHAPALALAGVGLARAWAFRRPLAAALGLAIVVPWGLGERELVRAWSDPAHAVRVWQVPSIDPPLRALESAGVRSTYASLQFAGRITLESGGGVIASQAWNERIPGDPLRFRDEVDLDPRPAWVLHSALSRGMPRAVRFHELVGETGGSATEEPSGDFVVFRDFVPPYDEAKPVPAAAITVSVLDGAVVRSGPARHGLQWVNGALRAGRQALLAIPLDGRTAGEVRLVFQGPGPQLILSEVFAYGPDEPPGPASGADAATRAYQAARGGDWTAAARLYAEAVRAEPDRASYHAAFARARWREGRRRRLDVEGIDDGGPDLVLPR